MITGLVTDRLEGIIHVEVYGPNGENLRVAVIVDSGFDGCLTLPLVLIESLGLPLRQRGRAELADGTTTLYDTYEGTVTWDGQPLRIKVDSAETTLLLGMGLLKGFELTMQVIANGRVMISRL